MKNRWVLGMLAALGGASMALAQQMIPYPPPSGPPVAYVAPGVPAGAPGGPMMPGAGPMMVPPGAGAMMPPPGAGPMMAPPGAMPGPMGPMMPPPGVPPTQYNGMPPPGSMQGLPGYGAIPAGGPPATPPLAATGGTAVPPSLGAPAGYMPAQSAFFEEPTHIAPGLRGSYTAFTEESPLYHSNNSCEFADGCPHCYVDAGAIGLWRYRLGAQTIATRDVSADETLPANRDGVILTPRDVDPSYQAGIRAEVGVFSEHCDFQVSGFWIPLAGTSATQTVTSRVDTFFVNPPAGFTDTVNNGLFIHAGQITEHFQQEIYSGEAMFRSDAFGFTGLTLLAGVRYFGNLERFQIDTVDDLTTPQVPTLQAEYTTRVYNNIAALQFGFDLYQPFGKYFAFNLKATTAPGVDFARVDTSLVRGDGLVGFRDEVNRVQFAELFDIGAFLDIFPHCDRIRLRAGYTAIWVVNVPEAVGNVNFDLSSRGQYNGNGNLFYHGPVATLTIRF